MLESTERAGRAQSYRINKNGESCEMLRMQCKAYSSGNFLLINLALKFYTMSIHIRN